MKHVLRVLAIPIFLVLFASCESSVTEAPQDTSTEIEALLSADWGEEDSLVLITSVPDYLARFEWDYTGQLSDGRHWGAAHAGDFLVPFAIMQIKTTYKHDRQDSYRTLATPECTMKKRASSLGLEDFADCIQFVSESCDTVVYASSGDGKSLEAHGMNVTYNDDNTATAVPCNPTYF